MKNQNLNSSFLVATSRLLKLLWRQNLKNSTLNSLSNFEVLWDREENWLQLLVASIINYFSHATIMAHRAMPNCSRPQPALDCGIRDGIQLIYSYGGKTGERRLLHIKTQCTCILWRKLGPEPLISTTTHQTQTRELPLHCTGLEYNNNFYWNWIID